MFYDTKIEILDGSFQKASETDADIQPFEKTMTFDDSIEIEITKRAFCDMVYPIDYNCYLEITGKLYKIMNIKAYSDYLELWLYECERDAA
jgi:hypothetical protein